MCDLALCLYLYVKWFRKALNSLNSVLVIFVITANNYINNIIHRNCIRFIFYYLFYFITCIYIKSLLFISFNSYWIYLTSKSYWNFDQFYPLMLSPVNIFSSLVQICTTEHYFDKTDLLCHKVNTLNREEYVV